MKTEYKDSYFTQMDATHWLWYASDGTDLGQIYYSLQGGDYVYEQPPDIAINITGLIEVFMFMRQL